MNPPRYLFINNDPDDPEESIETFAFQGPITLARPRARRGGPARELPTRVVKRVDAFFVAANIAQSHAPDRWTGLGLSAADC